MYSCSFSSSSQECVPHAVGAEERSRAGAWHVWVLLLFSFLIRSIALGRRHVFFEFQSFCFCDIGREKINCFSASNNLLIWFKGPRDSYNTCGDTHVSVFKMRLAGMVLEQYILRDKEEKIPLPEKCTFQLRRTENLDWSNMGHNNSPGLHCNSSVTCLWFLLYSRGAAFLSRLSDTLY